MNIKTSKISLLFAALISCTVPAMSFATTLTFDDLAPTSAYNGLNGSGYGGLNWSGQFYYINKGYLPGTGYDVGAVSGDYSAFNGGASDVSVSDGTFVFNSAYFTSAWENQILQLEGWLGGSLVYTANLSIVTSSATLFNFDWTVDTVKFHSTGSQFVMDNMTINDSSSVPETGTSVALLGFALVCAGYSRRFVRR